jgi:hypothetical protein
MKRSLYIVSLSFGALLLVVCGTTGLAAAHVLKQDNGISGVLHIPPEDNPQAGQPTELDVAFGSTNNTFSLADCNCQIITKSRNQVLQTVTPQPYLSGATLASRATVQFPQAGVYDVIVKGRAKDGTFNAFQLDYLVRVTAPAGATSPSNNGSSVVIISAGSLVILILVAYNAIQSGQRYKPKPDGSKPKSRSKS